MYIKWFVSSFIASLLLSCSPYNGGGELTGTRKAKNGLSLSLTEWC